MKPLAPVNKIFTPILPGGRDKFRVAVAPSGAASDVPVFFDKECS